MIPDKISLQNESPSSFTSNFAFKEKTILNKFVRKVLSIVAAQLAFTLGLVALFMFHEGVRLFIEEHPLVRFATFAISCGVSLLRTFRPQAFRDWPKNFLLLGALTVCEGFMVGIIAGSYNITEVIDALGITCAIILGLVIFSSTTDEDFTKEIVLAALLAAIAAINLKIFFGATYSHLLLSTGEALTVSVYLLRSLQNTMGNKSLDVTPEEYIFAALRLYIDIVRIFLQLLSILLRNKNQNKKQ